MTTSLDDPSALQRFFDSMRSRARPLPTLAQEPHASQVVADHEHEDGEVEVPRSQTQPINGYHRHQSDASKQSSEPIMITPASPSPPRRGLMPPQNTPQTAPASPHCPPFINDSPEENPVAVGEAIYEYVQGMKGVPLSESIWAPKHLPHQQSLLKGPRTPSRDLTPIKAVEPNPAINDTFTRMSFKAADTAIRPGMANAYTQTDLFLLTTVPEASNNPIETQSPLVASTTVDAPQHSTSPGHQIGEHELAPYEMRDTTLNQMAQEDDHDRGNKEEPLAIQKGAVHFVDREADATDDPVNPDQNQESERPRQVLVTKEQHELIIQRLKLVNERAEAQKRERIRKKMEALGMEPLETKNVQDAETHPMAHESVVLKSSQSESPVAGPIIASSSDKQEKSPPVSQSSRSNIAFKSNSLENNPSLGQMPGPNLLPHQRPKRTTQSENTPIAQSMCAGDTTIERSENVPKEPKAALKTANSVEEPEVPSKFLDKWGSEKTQVVAEPVIEEFSEGEISPKTVTAKDFSTVESPILPSIVQLKSSLHTSSPPSPILKDRTNLQPKPPLPSSIVKPEEDRTNQVYFSSWGALEKRDRPVAQIRTAHLRGLPPDSSAAFVARLVFGGPLEQIRVSNSQTSTTAFVVFLHGDDCKNFYDETANGLVYGMDSIGNEKVAWVSLGKDVDVLSSVATHWVALEYTRCVKAVPVAKDYERHFLWELAAGKRRKVEGIELGKTKGGARYIIFRFAELSHAVQFFASLRKEEEFERCNITFANDPCAEATRPRIKLGDQSN